ncbi:cytidine deaminase isoform X1 [Cygnus olor]|uniref:cytidine deaminase isoform X1 n=1 Tax=Cygnus olor TaxID=8869 RepID=UPI001ADE23D7|nr:cytidine deaminase isoform X1 [Cygnus olor]
MDVQITMFSACCVRNSGLKDVFGRLGDFCFLGETSGSHIHFLVSFPPPQSPADSFAEGWATLTRAPAESFAGRPPWAPVTGFLPGRKEKKAAVGNCSAGRRVQRGERLLQPGGVRRAHGHPESHLGGAHSLQGHGHRQRHGDRLHRALRCLPTGDERVRQGLGRLPDQTRRHLHRQDAGRAPAPLLRPRGPEEGVSLRFSLPAPREGGTGQVAPQFSRHACGSPGTT